MKKIDLNGEWEFAFAEGKSFAEANAGFEATDAIPVPGCYDMMPKWLVKRGTGLYRRTFTLDAPAHNAFFVVDGMGLTGRFCLDGRELGVVALPWSRFELETGPLEAGEHTLFAALDNRFDFATQKLTRPYYDFYCFGGFYHGVSLEVQEAEIEPSRVFVRTKDYASGTVELEVAFRGTAPDVFSAEVKFDTETVFHTVAFAAGRAVLQVPAFKVWSLEEPNLHTVTLRAFGGEKSERFGIREFKAEGNRFVLNGRPVYLKGTNRHEARPDVGASTDEAQMREDIALLKSIGGNFFRGAHYPQNDRFLELCDEAGILVWEESLGWGNRPDEMADAGFIAAQIEQTRLMVRKSFNHPSVVIFAFMNEFDSGSREGKALADKLIDTIRAEDSGRLVTFACNHTWNDICNEKTDIFAFNTYPGWIGDDEAETPEILKATITKAVNGIVEKFRKLYPGKPIMVSEMGTCGVRGFRDPAAAQWTEDFQAEYVGDVIEAVFGNAEIAGLTIWQFTDSRSYHRGGACIRTKPFAQNLAGIFDAFRRPKLVASVVREAFLKRMQTEGGAVEVPEGACAAALGKRD